MQGTPGASSSAGGGHGSPSPGVVVSDSSPCVTCCFPVKDDEEGGIACDECGQWCHGSQVCTGLPSDFVKQVLQHQGKGVKFVCTRCRLLPPAASGSGKENQGELGSLRECMTQMFNTIAGLSNSVRSIDLRFNNMVNDGVFSRDSGRVVGPDIRTIIKEEVRELSEREKRKDSIIIKGLAFG